MSLIAPRRKPDYTLPRGIADAFASAGSRMAPEGTILPDLRSVPTDAEWLRTLLAHRLTRWMYTATELHGKPFSCEWTTFEELYEQVNVEYRHRLEQWRYPADHMQWLREDEANAPRPEPKRSLGLSDAWADRARPEQVGALYNEALALCVMEEAHTAAFYLTCEPDGMVIGLPSIGYALAGALAYAVQVFDDQTLARDKWLDECNRIRRVCGLNGGQS